MSGFERMAAKIEEVIVNTDVIDAEDLLPQHRHLHIHSIGREDRARSRRGCGGWSREGVPVDLVIGGQRQGIQKDEERGDHIFRNLGPQKGAKRRLAWSRAILADQIRHQLLGPLLILPRDDCCLTDSGMTAQRGLDLAQFDRYPLILTW